MLSGITFRALKAKEILKVAEMKANMNHTFVICAYKESPFLEECVKSLLAQSESSVIKLATSTPNDYIIHISQKYNIDMYVNDGEKGIAGDWNFAYSLTDTEYVTIAHQDDIYESEYAKRVLEKLNTCRKKPLIAFTDYGEIKYGKREKSTALLKIKRMLLLPIRPNCMQNKKWIKRGILSLGNPICCPSVTYARKNIPDKLFMTHFRSNVDWETWERLSKLDGSFVYCKDVLMFHRIHEGSETSSVINENKRGQEDYEMFQKFWPRFIAKMLTKKYASSEKYNKG